VCQNRNTKQQMYFFEKMYGVIVMQEVDKKKKEKEKVQQW
jgi:hypothetical protein